MRPVHRIEEIERLANRPEALRQGLHTAAKFNNVRVMMLPRRFSATESAVAR